MKFVIFSVSNPLNPAQVSWGWKFVDSNGTIGLNILGMPSAEDARTNLEDYLTVFGVDPAGVTIEEE